VRVPSKLEWVPLFRLRNRRGASLIKHTRGDAQQWWPSIAHALPALGRLPQDASTSLPYGSPGHVRVIATRCRRTERVRYVSQPRPADRQEENQDEEVQVSVRTNVRGHLAIGLAFACSALLFSDYQDSAAIVIVAIMIASIASYSVRVADQWERVVVLRLGRFHALQGPGLFFIIPIIDPVAHWIDTRVITSTFKAEKTLTRDTVPVDVDAVLFWKVLDAKKAALDVADYDNAINWTSQTALRDVIGKTALSDMLEGRQSIGAELQRIIDARAEPCGVNIISVEIKDVLIPTALQDAMSMQAQAERERQARVILGDSERQIAVKFGEAAETYANSPTAFHLRAMNMLYEGLKKNNGTIVIVPSTAVETMQLGGMAAGTVLTATSPREGAPGRASAPWSGSSAVPADRVGR
jgi:regulator of protease activity HflC (stomatin/prohibitin superfamily)